MSKPLRVVFDGRYIQNHFPGIGRYSYHLVEALSKLEGVQLDLLVNQALANSRYNIFELGGRVTLRPCPVPTFSLQEQTKLPRLIRELRADIYHTPYYIKPLVQPVPTVLTMHDVLPLRVPQAVGSGRAVMLFKAGAYLGLKTARRIITVSNASRQDISRFRISPGRVTVIYEAAAPGFRPYRHDDPRLAAVRTKYHLPERFVLYVGINKPHKNLVRLVDAWGKLGAGREDWYLIIAGREDPRYTGARKMAEKRGLNVRFLGEVEEAYLPALYNAAGIFVFPSLYEGFGLPVLEAMACGTPVLCSNASSLPEVAGNAAVLFTPTDTHELAEGLACLTQDESVRADLSERGLKQAARFSWERTARETLSAYRLALL